jgi:hypothetical protein
MLNSTLEVTGFAEITAHPGQVSQLCLARKDLLPAVLSSQPSQPRLNL